VTSWIGTWDTWVVRLDGRLIGAVRARRAGTEWDIGRLMVAPDVAGRGLGRWLLAEAISLFTGKQSLRNIAMYQRAGFELTDDPAPPSAVSLRKPVSRSSA
jgi:GNAT superfamily N-acetyltransferase